VLGLRGRVKDSRNSPPGLILRLETVEANYHIPNDNEGQPLRRSRPTTMRGQRRLADSRDVRVGIDIGGTFTDLVAQTQTGVISRVKVLTTPASPADGALKSVRKFLHENKVDPKRVRVVVHATTLASNALLTGSLPKVALVTTEGFRDVIEIGRQNRPELYNLQFDRLPPLVPGKYRFEVHERISYDGRVLEPIRASQVESLARTIAKLGIESVAICFLHSYANPRHERIAAKTFRRVCSRVYLSVSSELTPEFREYERTSTTVVNACLQPVISRYLSALRAGLASLGIRAPLFVMQSNSGTLLSSQASREPSRIIESGPVAGAVASRVYGMEAKAREIISLDVGGTTAKAGVWSGNRFDITEEYEVGGRLHGVRRLVGSGYPVRFPYVDLVEVGIGGGSLAKVDDVGVMHVGPESAGASPGPACYNLGGTKPTLTDANLVLGRLNPEHLLGGELVIDAQRARNAIREHVAEPMHTSVSTGAVGILRVATANMAQALRAASIERGRDPRSMVLVAFGGAGPMHACELAKQLEMRRVLVPPRAGLFSSLGLLLAEPLHDFVRTILSPAQDANLSVLDKTFHGMEERGKKLLEKEQVNDDDMAFERLFDMRYAGQSYELSIPISRERVSRGLLSHAINSFHSFHHRQYGYSAPADTVELVNLRVYAKGRARNRPPKADREFSGRAGESHRKVFFDGRFVNNCPIYTRVEMSPGSKGKGPCIVEDYDSTLVIPPRSRYMVDEFGSFSIALS
jgi:N-methylhydantoinase A